MAAAMETGPMMKAIEAFARSGYVGRSTNVSLRNVQAVAERWRKISLSGCLEQTITLDGRNLVINDIRVTASVARLSTWDEDAKEQGVCIIQNLLVLKKKGLYWEAPLRVGCSLHGLGRWHQRSLVNTPDALLTDLKLLAEAAPQILAAGSDKFEVATNGGAWKGHRATGPDRHVFLDCRTFTWT
jgi:hypothetical protein